MAKFILRRLLWVIPVMLGVVLIVFTIDRVGPGDPVAAALGGTYTQEQYDAKEAELGLDRPFLVQFFSYLQGIITRGDLGDSFQTGLPVGQTILQRFPLTLELAIISIIIAVGLGIPFGVISATRQNSILDRIVTFFSLIFAAVPGFWLALMLMIAFAINLKIFDASFPTTQAPQLRDWVLPALASGLSFIASITRMTRSSMLDVVRQDYITTARAKGQKESVVIRRHALRNALIPVITTVGAQLGILVSGSVVVETIFGMPGLGSLMMTAINNKDFPIIEGCVLILAALICIINLVTDLIYGFVDPRIMAQYTAGKKKKRGPAGEKEGAGHA